MRIETSRIDLFTLDGVSIHDISGELGAFLSQAGVRTGLCVLSLGDTDCALTLTDDLEETYEDLIRMGRDQLQEEVAETLPSDDRLDEIPDPGFVPAITAEVLTLPIRDGRLGTGAWESIILIDPLGPARRHIDVTVVGE